MTRKWQITGALVAGALACATAAYAAVTLNGAGATFPYPLYSKWIAEYHKATGTQVNYQSIGSGGGIKQLQARTVDFGGSDAPISDGEMKSMPDQVLHIPTCFGAVSVAYNLSIKNINLDPSTLSGIFLGEIDRWNDKKIKDQNPGVALPNQKIVVCHRSDGSGTTFIFTDYLSKVNAKWAAKVGNDKSVNWPVGLGGKGNEGVAGLIKQNPGAIGYVELAYAMKNKLQVAKLRNKSGKFVAPSLDGTSAAAAGASTAMKRDVRVSLCNAVGEKSYPIVGATYLLVYVNQSAGAKTTELIRFLNWANSAGQKYCKDLLYAPLPPAVQNINSATIKSIKVK